MSDLAALFQLDPLKMTKDDLSAIVKGLRDARHQFNAGTRGAGKMSNEAKAKAIESLKDKLDLSNIKI